MLILVWIMFFYHHFLPTVHWIWKKKYNWHYYLKSEYIFFSVQTIYKNVHLTACTTQHLCCRPADDSKKCGSREHFFLHRCRKTRAKSLVFSHIIVKTITYVQYWDLIWIFFSFVLLVKKDHKSTFVNRFSVNIVKMFIGTKIHFCWDKQFCY